MPRKINISKKVYDSFSMKEKDILSKLIDRHDLPEIKAFFKAARQTFSEKCPDYDFPKASFVIKANGEVYAWGGLDSPDKWYLLA